MEDSTAIDQTSASGRSSSRHLRYPLRSSANSKEEKPSVADSSSVLRRGRSASSVSKSIGVLDLSGKEKSAKPPRRLSIPSKTGASKPIGSITPVSEIRSTRSSVRQGKNATPVSDISKSSDRKKFSMISSASYWLSQIKLSESAAKHSISLGFFKLALVAGCEPLQQMKDELKSYARKNNLSEYGESVKELFENYNLLESFEQLQVSETCSHVPEEGTRSSDEDVHSTPSITEAEHVSVKLSDTDAAESKQVNEPNKETTDAAESKQVNEPNKETSDAAESKQLKEPIKATKQKKDTVPKIGRSANRNAANLKSAPDSGGRKSQKKPQKSKQESTKKMYKVKKPGKMPAHDEGSVDLPVEKTLEEDKENLDSPKVEDINASEV